MIINKQITIIITCPKPVVSPKLIYDELRLKFLGMEEWREERGYCLCHRTPNGAEPALAPDGAPPSQGPGRHPHRVPPPGVSRASWPCPAR